MLGTATAILRPIIPAPRRPLTVSDVLAPTLFLLGFAALCLALEWTRTLIFASPNAFWLMVLTPWVWWMHVAGFSGLTGWRSQLAVCSRMALLGGLVMLLAEPRAVRVNHALSLMYALDASDSVGEAAADKALEFITRTAAGKPDGDEAGLLVFARSAAVELPPRQSFPFEAVNSQLSRDGTDLAKALSLAAAMLPADNRARIVLISDGSETAGRIGPVLDELKARDIPVDVLPVSYQYAEEVWLEKLELPRFVKPGETYEAAVVLSSLQAGNGTLVFRENGREIARQPIAFAAGKSRFLLPLYLREPGYYEYEAIVEVPPGRDNRRENNIAIGHLYIAGEGKILVVTDPDGDPRDWDDLVRAMREAERDPAIATAYEFPRDPLSLMPFDCVVFVNVPADAFDAVQMQAVREAVYHQGVGFLMVGGEHSFGPGGYHRTEVEKALPVSMDVSQKKVLPKGALAIILHTCEFPEGNTWGKRITKKAIKVLGARDEVGVLAYDYQGGDSWLFPLTPAGEYDKLAVKINQATIGDMPSFATTMRLGLEGLKKSDAATKHMIIISDGDPSPPPPELVNGFKAAKVSISMVAVFPHGGMDISIMRSIAASTGGRYYFPQDPNLLPAIFVKEAKTLKRHMIQNVTFTPVVDFPSPILKGIEAIPPLKGFVLSTAKPRATVILKSPEENELDPVLATWRYGTGKTAAYTSDLGRNWGVNWVGWDHYQAFVKQLLTDVSRVRKPSTLRIQTYAEGSRGVVLIEDHSDGDRAVQIQAAVAGPRQRSDSLTVRQLGPRRYEASFPLWGKGRYQVSVHGTAGDRTEQLNSGFAVPYSPEYLRFRSDPNVLRHIAGETGGRLLDGTENGVTVFARDRSPKRSSRPVADWFLLAIAILIPVDVGARRIQIDFSVIRAWLRGRRRGESTETMNALLRRKQAIRTSSETAEFAPARPLRRPAAGRPSRPTSPQARPVQPSQPASPPVSAEPEDGAPVSTTARLLARKRSWKAAEDDDG